MIKVHLWTVKPIFSLFFVECFKTSRVREPTTCIHVNIGVGSPHRDTTLHVGYMGTKLYKVLSLMLVRVWWQFWTVQNNLKLWSFSQVVMCTLCLVAGNVVCLDSDTDYENVSSTHFLHMCMLAGSNWTELSSNLCQFIEGQTPFSTSKHSKVSLTSMNRYRIFFVPASTQPPSMPQNLPNMAGVVCKTTKFQSWVLLR